MGKKNSSPTAFDPNDTQRVRHTKLGVWDFYQEINSKLQYLPGSNTIERIADTINTLPYVWKMFKDIGSMKDCRFRLILLFIVQFVAALIPATALW